MKLPTIVEMVEKASDKIWHKLPDVTSFEHTCYVNIGREIKKGIKESTAATAHYYIERAKARHISRTTYEPPSYLADLSEQEEGEQEIEYEPEDVLANVESDVIAKEMAALLAQDDRRKSVVEAWTVGNTNTQSISRTLARTFGGNAESHRKFVQRFRNECHAILDAVI